MQEKIDRKRDTDIVWYYCNRDVFKSIVTRHELWLSDITKSNDANEIKSSLQFAKKSFNSKLKKTFEFKDNALIEKLLNIYNARIEKTEIICYWFAMCFSKTGNNLIHWRAYGDNGKGFSIGFSYTALKELIKEYSSDGKRNIFIDNVEYVMPLQSFDRKVATTDKRICFINDVNEKLCELLKRLWEGKNTNETNLYERVESAIRDSISEMVVKIAFYKDSDFSMENETRICYSRYISHKKLAFLNISKKSLLKTLDFTFNDNDITPHVTLKIQGIQKYIKEIYIGPNNNATKHTLWSFLINKGNFFDYGKNEPDKRLIIKKSEISCR